MKNTCSKINTITAVLLLCAVMLSFPVFAKETDESASDDTETAVLSEADQTLDKLPEEQEMFSEEVPPEEPENLMPTAEQTVPDENPAENEQGQDNPEEKQDEGKSPDSDIPEETVVDPIRMSELDTPQVDAGNRVKFSVIFTAVEGYEIESVEMQTSTDINVLKIRREFSNIYLSWEIITNLLYININTFYEKNVFSKIKILRRMTLFYMFAHLFNIWL